MHLNIDNTKRVGSKKLHSKNLSYFLLYLDIGMTPDYFNSSLTQNVGKNVKS